MKIERQSTLLNVESIEASLHFYEAIGFVVAERWEEAPGTLGWCRMDHGPLRVMLNRTDRARSAERRARPDYSDFVGYIYVESAAAVAAQLSAAGLPHHPVGPQDYGLDEVWARDPDGYHWVFASRSIR